MSLKFIFSSPVIEWNKLNPNLQNANSSHTFKNILQFIRPSLTHLMPLVSFDTPLKTSENQRFSDVFRGHRKRPVAGTKWVKQIFQLL